jgi:hypothetical protein
MTNIINWLKRNWALAILAVVFLNWLLPNFFGVNLSSNRGVSYGTLSTSSKSPGGSYAGIGGLADFEMMPSISSQAPPTDTTNRLIIKDTSLSLQVKNVEDSINSIELTTQNLGGFLVNSFLSKPELAASGNITVRIPEDKRSQALDAFKKLSVKVVSESIYGADVTDQYVDIESRLAILDQTKLKFQEIMDRAVTVNDLMNVQQQLINLQSQIDSLKGQQKYLEQSAKLAKIVIYLSTDDLSLPYSPTNEWRPAVIFKQAVRSLIGSLRSLGTLIIWLAVYSPLLLVAYLVYRYVKSRRS